jgi:acetylornithine deacetylase/succinyl-diaminopimelate desuccinylase-like protein
MVLALPAAAQDSSADYQATYQTRALEIYRTLIGFRTAETHGQVGAAATFLAEQFVAGGFPEEDVHVLPFTRPSGEETASLVVRYASDGSSGERPILLTAHMDVVDALPQDWERDPFTLVEEDGYFFGRGTSDDKFGVAQLTATFLRLKDEGFVPTRDLVIGFTGDEESGMLTTKALAEDHRDLTDAEFALNADGGGGILNEAGEPESFLIQGAEKYSITFELEVTNPGGHSSTPRTDNAIYELAEALRRIEVHRFPVRTNDVTLAYLRAAAPLRGGEVGQAMRQLAADPTDEDAAEVLWHQPGEVGVTRTTCIPTMLRGGHARNALPQSAVATVNCRIFPDVDHEQVQAVLEGVVDNPGVRFTIQGTPRFGPPSPVRDDVMEAMSVGVETIHPGTPLIPYMAPYGTDGLRYRSAGIPTYGVMGLFMKDSDRFEHGLNERVPVRAFYDALEFWYSVLEHLAGPPAA